MTEDLRAAADISESFSLQNHHWSFEQFHISFKKSESAPPAVFEGDGSTCLLIICLDGEVHLNLAQPGTCKDMHIAPGDCALIYSPGKRTAHTAQSGLPRQVSGSDLPGGKTSRPG